MPRHANCLTLNERQAVNLLRMFEVDAWAAGRNALEDPWIEPDESMFTRSVSPEEAPDQPTYVEIEYEKGDPVAINGDTMSPASLLASLNKVSLCVCSCMPHISTSLASASSVGDQYHRPVGWMYDDEPASSRTLLRCWMIANTA